MSRPRLLSRDLERQMLEEVRVARYYTMKKIAQRFGITVWSMSNYLRRARLDGRLER